MRQLHMRQQEKQVGAAMMGWLVWVIDYGIIGTLLGMSIIAVAVAIERFRLYANTSLDAFADKKELELHLTRKLHIIATVGSNAPYVGLLGTVLGIMFTFASIGQDGITDPGKMMAGLALALKATAIGLLVAIPAVVLYNFLLRRAKELMMKWEIVHGRKGI
jgi:biopolymer transport protein ExbB